MIANQIDLEVDAISDFKMSTQSGKGDNQRSVRESARSQTVTPYLEGMSSWRSVTAHRSRPMGSNR